MPDALIFGRTEMYIDNLLNPNVSGCKYLCTIVCQKNCDLDIKIQIRTVLLMLICVASLQKGPHVAKIKNEIFY